MRRRLGISGGTVFLACLTATAAQGGWAARVPAEYRSWTLHGPGGKEQRVSQLSVPLVATVGFGPQASLVLTAAGVSSRTSVLSANADNLNGASDVNAQLYYRVPARSLTLLAGVNLPTGRAGLDTTEFKVSQALAHPLLGMRTKQYSRGFSYNAGLAWSAPLFAAMHVGLGAGYRSSAAYDLADGWENYTPTPELSLSGGLSWERSTWAGGRHRAQTRCTYRMYGIDKIGSRSVFEEADQFEVSLDTTHDAGPFEFGAGGLVVSKGSDRSFRGVDGVQQAHDEKAGTAVLARATMERVSSTRWRPGLAADWKHIGGSDAESHNGDTYGVGPTLAVSLGGRQWIRGQALLLGGSLGSGSEAVDLRGFAIALSLILRPRP